MSPFQLLQISPDADERDIKRAYAQLLKHTRPDDDAAAFQHLQEAYARCLDIVRARVSTTLQSVVPDGLSATPGPDEMDARWHAPRRESVQPETSSPEPATDVQQPADPEACYFDVAAFVGGLHEVLGQQDARRMRDWLNAQEPLYSIQLKHALRPIVVRAIGHAPHIQERQVVAVLLAFFGLDQLDHDGLAHEAQAVLHARFNRERLDRAVVGLRAHGQSWLSRRIAAELESSSVNPLRRVLLMIIPMIPTRIRNLLAHLRAIDPTLRHPRLNPGSINYWMQASDRVALQRPRLVMIALRVVVWNTLLFGWLAVVVNDNYPDLLRTAGFWMAASAVLWTVYALVKLSWLHAWNWAAQRLQLTRDEFSAISFALLGVALSWIPGLTPLPALIGVVTGHLRLIGTLPPWQRVVSVFLSVGYGVGLAMLSVYLEGRIEPETRVTLILTLTALPLVLSPLIRHLRYRPSRWSPWLLAQAGIAALVLIAYQIV